MGDDTAAIRTVRDRVALLTTDAFVEGTHFLKNSPGRAVGEAVAAASLSDLAAKGGEPVALLLDLLLPSRVLPEWPREVVEGAERMLGRYRAHVVGGDTKQSAVRSVVGTMLGWADPSRLAPRAGARPGDVLVTTGTVGRGGLAALVLRSRRTLRLVDHRALLRIRPRVREGRIMARVAHAMIDTSDGIAEAAHLLAEASERRLTLRSRALPIEPALSRMRGSSGAHWNAAFYGGDYELLAAVPRSRVPSLIRQVGRVGTMLTVVGTVSRGSGAYLEVDGRSRSLPHAGWNPFAPGTP